MQGKVLDSESPFKNDLNINIDHLPQSEVTKASNDHNSLTGNETSLPPDGGYGWLVVLASFLILFIQFGVTYTFGIFLTHYKKKYEGRVDITDLSFLGTTCTAVAMFASVISGKVADRIGYRYSVWVGGFLFSLGLLLASFAEQFWVLLLTQGIMTGIGGGFLFIPAVSVPSQWFLHKRGLAMGIAFTGSGLGGLVLAPLIELSIKETSVKSTLQYLSILSFTSFALSGFFIRTRIPTVSKAWVDWKRFLDPHFRTFFIGYFMFSLGYVVPIFLFPSYAAEINISKSQSALALGLLTGSSALGRLLFGFLADILGAMNTFMTCGVIYSLITLLLWPFCSSFFSLTLYGIIYGLSSGGFVSLVPVTLAQVFGVEKLPSSNGLIYFGTAIPILVGTPIATAFMSIYSTPEKKVFTPAIYYVASVLILATSCFVYLRFRLDSRIFKKI